MNPADLDRLLRGIRARRGGRPSHEDRVFGGSGAPTEVKVAIAEASLRHKLAMARRHETATAVMEGRLAEVEVLRAGVAAGNNALRAGLERFVHAAIVGQDAIDVIADTIRAVEEAVEGAIAEAQARGRDL